MTEEIEGLIQKISMNQVLVSILQEYKRLTVPTLGFLDASFENKELVIDYDEKDLTFTFSVRDNNNTKEGEVE